MSLMELGKNDISEETQAFKDRLASQDSQNAGLRTQLMRREAELEELQATLNETVYKLSKEAERALQFEGEALARSSELKTERISLRNIELALQSAQEKLKAEEREKRELESTLDTVSSHSQATSAEHQAVQREKRALESRVRELERIVQTHEARSSSNIPSKKGRPRSSSVSSFRLPGIERELNDAKAQLHSKETNLRALEQKLAQAQDDLVKAENARISVDKAGQKRISELLVMLEMKEEELESFRPTDNAGEREEELLKRIDEDAAKIAALEKLAAEGQAARTSQTRIQQLQRQLKAECEKVHRCEDLQSRLLREKEDLAGQCAAAQREIEEGHQLIRARECQIQELEAKDARLRTELDAHNRLNVPPSFDAGHPSSPLQRSGGLPGFPDESALADHIQTLLQAVDRLRGERDELKRALEFSEVEYRITADGFQSRISSLTRQLAESTESVPTDKPRTNAFAEQRLKQLTSCAAAFAVVISNMQTNLDLSDDRLSSTSVDLASSNSQLHDALAVIDDQKRLLNTDMQEHGILLHKLDAVAKELSDSEEERNRLRLQLAAIEGRVASALENANASETAKEEVQQSLLSTELRLATLDKNYQDVESERNSLALQITNIQDDLARVQDELLDTQDRYNTLHTQQLSAMSTSEAAQALKDRIQELEGCLDCRSGQISDYQHDIRRLETNVKLHEERLAELMSELELLASQKEAMVEDCAEARQARDDAIGRSEAIEEEVERLQLQLQLAKQAHEAEMSATSSTIADLKSENQQSTARLADLQDENAGIALKLDCLDRDRQHLTEQLSAAVSRSRSLELQESEGDTGMRQAILSLAIVYREYKDSTRQLQRSHGRDTVLESQLAILGQELEQKTTLVEAAEKERQHLLQISDIPPTTEASQDDPTSFSCVQTSTEELSSTGANSLQETEQELAAARQLLEETKSHYAEVEEELRQRITTMTTMETRYTQDVASLQEELENVRTQLKNSLENFAELEKLHDDVIQELTTAKQIFELRLTETDAQLCSLDVEHQRSLATVESRYRHEMDILASSLEDREHEVEELRQELEDMLEAHTRAEGKLQEELKSYEARHTFMDDLEEDLRRSVADMRQRLTQAETETLALQEERQLLQAQITGFQAEMQRSTSLTRYLENQVRESEDACMLLKENLRQTELTLAESEKAGKAAEFSLSLQTTQYEKVVAALHREITSLQSGPELRSALADLQEKNREMDDLLRAKCQEIEEYDDRILETLKANKKLTSKVESLTRKIQALQAKLSLMKTEQETPAEATPPKASSSLTPLASAPAATPAGNHPGSSHTRENSGPSLTFSLRSKTPEPRLQSQSVVALPSSHTPCRTSDPPECEVSAGKKRPAPDDDERDTVPAEGHYSTDASLRNGPTPRLRRAHGHPGGFTPVRGATSRKPAGLASPGRRVNVGITPSEIITDVTNSPRGPSGQRDAQLKKRSWLGKVKSGAGTQSTSSRLGTFRGQ